MTIPFLPRAVAGALVAVLAASLTLACGERARYPFERGVGPDPLLPPPVLRPLPTVKVAPIKGWAADTTPTPASDLQVKAFARDLDHPRWLYLLPNGDVLVAESSAPARAGDALGLKQRLSDAVMHRAGARPRSADRITLLRDADGDGVAEVRTRFLDGLYSPLGMALVGDRLYVANADALVSFGYRDGDTHLDAAPTFLANLPGGINHHWTKSLLASDDGRYLYVGVGANSNIGENGHDVELNRAAILRIDRGNGRTEVFADGLRNPVGLAWEPVSGRLWTVVNERDGLGSDLVPDYLTAVREGGFYGWPYSYYGQHLDPRVQPQEPARVALAIRPDYALGAHSAALGLAFSTGALLPPRWRNGAFIGLHGSWNRDPPSGYRVVFVAFAHGRPQGMPITVLDGFLAADGAAHGRPVGVALDRHGALLVADDAGNVVWRVTPKPVRPAS